MTDRDPLYVTRATLPPIGELLPLLEQIWHSRILSNFGSIHRQLEAALSRHLGIEHLTLVANATLGLILSLLHLGAKMKLSRRHSRLSPQPTPSIGPAQGPSSPTSIQ